MSLSICLLAFKWLGFVNFVQDIVLPLRNLNLLFNERFSLGNFIYNIIFTNVWGGIYVTCLTPVVLDSA